MAFLIGMVVYVTLIFKLPNLHEQSEPPSALSLHGVPGSPAIRDGVGTDVLMLVHYDSRMEGPFPPMDVVLRVVRSALMSTMAEGGRVHVLSDHAPTLEALRASNMTQGLFLDDLRLRKPATLQEFKKVYRHQSINGPIYESFCFWRWFAMYDYLREVEGSGTSISRILTLDSDILLVQQPHMLINKEWAVNWVDQEAIAIIPGGCVMWTMKGLRSWIQYILSTYQDKALFQERVTKYGIKMTCENSGKYGTTCENLRRACRSGVNAEMIPCQEDEGLWHISDMMLQDGYFAEAPNTRHHLHWQAPDQCVTIGNVMYWRDHRIIMVNGSPTLDSNKKPLCLVHFQVSAPR
jgi:hypothetical protein